jgi:hypothetical protein
MPRNLNDGSILLPRLKVYLHMRTLEDLPDFSIWPRLEGEDALAFLKAAGFDGIQDGNPMLCRRIRLGSAGSGRVDKPSDAELLAQRMKDLGHQAATVHVGTGFEDDPTIDALVDAVLLASERHNFPIYIENHRATITQDIWRTIQLVKRIPAIRFNGDFSHYYTGHELTYGDYQSKLQFMQPVFDRVCFLHGRIGNSGCMQVDVGDGESSVPQAFGRHDFVAHFRSMWTRAMCGFLASAGPGDYLVFAPEILSPMNYYGRQFLLPDGTLCQESDRYAQALVLATIARECFEAAKQHLKKDSTTSRDF